MTPYTLPLLRSPCLNRDRRVVAAPPDCLVRAVEMRAGRRVRDLRVEWVGEVGVVLHGRTDSYHAKQLAQHVVGQVFGRVVVANRIEVRLPPAPPAVWPPATLRRDDAGVPVVSA